MFVKSDIRKITIAFDKEHQRRVYLALGKAGLVHLARFHEKIPWRTEDCRARSR